MAFELLIKFVDQISDERILVKTRVIRWLEAIGRGDFVEGVIDGIESRITEYEKSSGLIAEDRFEDAPIALFDEQESESRHLLKGLEAEFAPHIVGQITEILDDSWAQCWREVFAPLETGKFFIVPLSSPVQGPLYKVRIELICRHDAFGTGQHATTRAVIKTLEDNIGRWRPGSLLDVGTGTGIYLILAALLGVPRLAGTEISEDLANVARENCQIAGVQADVVVADRPIFPEKFDLVVANILAPVLHELIPDISRCLSAGGRLILAGFIDKESAPLILRAESFGLTLESRFDELGWKCLVFSSDKRGS